MKTMNLLTLTVVTGSLLTLTARAGIVGSPHDFHSATWNTDASDPNTVCSVCHTPHHGDNTYIPLWSHATTVQGFTMYSTNTVAVSNMKAVPSSQPTGASMACLSCHDGVTAINTYGGVNRNITHGGAAQPLGPGNSATIGTDLTHSHPISFTYDLNLVGTGPNQDQWLWNPDSTEVLQPDGGLWGPANSYKINDFLLGGNHRVECTSCHDIHNQVGTPYGPNNLKLVKIVGTQAGVGSLLCRSCHNK